MDHWIILHDGLIVQWKYYVLCGYLFQWEVESYILTCLVGNQSSFHQGKSVHFFLYHRKIGIIFLCIMESSCCTNTSDKCSCSNFTSRSYMLRIVTFSSYHVFHLNRYSSSSRELTPSCSTHRFCSTHWVSRAMHLSTRLSSPVPSMCSPLLSPSTLLTRWDVGCSCWKQAYRCSSPRSVCHLAVNCFFFWWSMNVHYSQNFNLNFHFLDYRWWLRSYWASRWRTTLRI